MTKKYLFICVFLITTLFFSACKNDLKIQEEYFYRINALIKDEDFHVAQVEVNKIVLCNEENEIQKEILFNDYNDSIKIINIRKNGSLIYFITGGSVDDEQGIVFINDNSNKKLDGITTLKRIGGNSYQYMTCE